jgi:predicted KAP-like P-loop ATPase
MQVDTQDRFYNEIQKIKKKEQKLKQKLIKNKKLMIIRPQVNEMLL